MNAPENEHILTPSAKDALESAVREYRERILEEAHGKAISVPGGEKEISVRDILESVDRVSKFQRRIHTKRLEIITQIYSILGIMVTLVGIAYLMFGRSGFTLNLQEQIAVIFVVIGIVLAVSPIFYRKWRYLNLTDEQAEIARKNRIISSVVFIKYWNLIENELRNRVERMGASTTRMPISSIVQSLQKTGGISNADAGTLKFLLSLRNEIVHGSHRVDREHLDAAMSEAERLLKKLKPNI